MVDRDEPVVVVGAGVIGLTTAVCLAEQGRPVRVWAQAPPPQTTSAVAAALWRPGDQEPAGKAMAWAEQSLEVFRELAERHDAGVRLAPTLTAWADPAGDAWADPAGDESPWWMSLFPSRRCGSSEVPDGFIGGVRSVLPLVDMPRYLDYLMARLASLGVEVEIRTVRSLAEAAEVAPVMVNCAGLGARDLAADTGVRPIFGLHVVVTNPGLDEVFLPWTQEAEWTSYFPHRDRVVCGGIRVPDRWDLGPDPEVAERILDRCRQVEPRLRDAEIIASVTGLRPYRDVVRLVAEPLGSALCVHNYGHGGNGVTLSWGCAREAARLATR